MKPKISVKDLKYDQYVRVKYPRQKPFYGWVYDVTYGPGSLGPVADKVYVQEKSGIGRSHLVKYVSLARERNPVKKKWQGLSPNRYRYNSLEKVFALHWQSFNEESRMLDYLLALLAPGGQISKPAEVSQPERLVANTVIQWLGSPVGRMFLAGVLKTKEGKEFLKAWDFGL